jgi:SAM-dependent methyltransferase
MDRLTRESNTCSGCLSTVRSRSMMAALSWALFGRVLAMSDFPDRPDLRGLGMSDWAGYAAGLTEHFAYVNTFYTREPRLDISAPLAAQHVGAYDFVVTSDVLEHVRPPVLESLQNCRRLLRQGGVLVLSVPYTLNATTVEHYPRLHDYHLADVEGEPVLVNVTATGEREEFRDLVFHGQSGTNVEMRVFSESDLLASLAACDFAAAEVFDQEHLQFGIAVPEPWSLPVVARATG